MSQTKRTIPGGLFIVFEGFGGSGKTSANEAAAAHLRGLGYDVLVTRQPGGTPVGAKLREIVLSNTFKTEIDSLSQLFIYAADRRIHIEQVIRPALAAGTIVLCDRYDHSTRAYQAAGGGDPVVLETVNHIATNGLRPHRAYWFDVEVDTALERIRRAGRTEDDRFDEEERSFWQRLRSSYAAQTKANPREILRLDAGQPREAVAGNVITDLTQLLAQHPPVVS